MSAARVAEHAPSLSGERIDLHDLSVEQFAAALASAEPSPGGSTAAALPAALAAGLVAMVARLTAACVPFSDLAFDMDTVVREADELRAELLDLLDDDTGAFDRVLEVRRGLQATAEPHPRRVAEIQRAYEEAVEPPLRLCRRSLRVLELAADVAARGNPHAALDADVALVFAAASFEAAVLTTEVYLLPIESEAFRTARSEELQGLRAQAGRLCESARRAACARPAPASTVRP